MSEFLVISFALTTLTIVWSAIVLSKVSNPLYKWFEGFTTSRHKVEWLRELTTHFSVYGSVLATLLGLNKESSLFFVFAFVWLVVLVLAGYWLTNVLEELES